MANITVLSIYDRIACFHTLRPFLLYHDQALFDYTNSVDFCLQRDRNRILVMVRWFLKPDRVDMEVMRRLRDKYDRIIFFTMMPGEGYPVHRCCPM